MNCQLYTGIVVESLGRTIPEVPRSAELWLDEEHTAHVAPGEPMETGDIVFLVDDPTKAEDPKRFHVGVILVGENGIPLLTHNATHHGFAVIERLADATLHYGTIAGIKRPISNNPNGADHAFLEEHGILDLIQTA